MIGNIFIYLSKEGDAYDLGKIHITRMATNQKSFQKDKYYMDIEKYIINYSLKQNNYKQSFLRFSEERSFLYNSNIGNSKKEG